MMSSVLPVPDRLLPMALDICRRKATHLLVKYAIVCMGGVFAKYSVQAVAWLFSKKSGLFFGISRFKKIDTVS